MTTSARHCGQAKHHLGCTTTICTAGRKQLPPKLRDTGCEGRRVPTSTPVAASSRCTYCRLVSLLLAVGPSDIDKLTLRPVRPMTYARRSRPLVSIVFAHEGSLRVVLPELGDFEQDAL